MPDYVHCYRARRPSDWNTCGQAAIATIADFWGLDPWNLSRPVCDEINGRHYWDDCVAVDAVAGSGFGPNVIFGLGTTGGVICNALRCYGLTHVAVTRSGIFTAGGEKCWRQLHEYVEYGYPAPVIVDCGQLGGTRFTAHWAIVYRISDGRVSLGAMGGIGDTAPTVDVFLDAWRCWFLPAGFSHCAVYGHR